MDFKLSFGTGFKFLALVAVSVEFFENRVRSIFASGRLYGIVENRSKTEKVRRVGVRVVVGAPPV